MNLKAIDTKAWLNTITHNWTVKVLCIAIAIVLFVFHQVSSLGERFFSVPLIVESREGMIPSSPYPRVVRVSLRGDPSKIALLVEEDIETYIDLRSYTKAGSYKESVQVRKRGNAVGLTPLEITVEPMMVNLDLDYNVGKIVPVSANIQGTVAEGYELASYGLKPMQVQVYGPSQLIVNLASLSTEVIDIEGRSEDFSVMIALMNRDPLISLPRDTHVEFHCSIQEMGVIKAFDIPVTISGLEPHFASISHVMSATVEFEGAKADLEDWSAPPNFLVADCHPISNPGTYTVPLSIPNLPSKLKLIRINPSMITITVQGAASQPLQLER